MGKLLPSLVAGLYLSLTTPALAENNHEQSNPHSIITMTSCYSLSHYTRLSTEEERQRGMELLYLQALRALIASYDTPIFKTLTGKEFNPQWAFYRKNSLMEDGEQAYICATAGVDSGYVRLFELFQKVGKN